MIPHRRRLAPCLIAAALLLTACSGGDQVAIGGPFRLIDQNGRPQDQSILRGKWSAVYFGYTYCPDVCPTTLQTLAEAQDRLGPKGKALQTVFITVDPERDTPSQIRSYLSNSAFPKDAIGLTGSPAQIAAAAKAYRLYYQKQGAGADYGVQHSSAVYLMDRDGRFNRVLAYGLTPEQEASQIADAMR